MPARMIVNTGASIMVVSVAVADRLAKTGLAIEAGRAASARWPTAQRFEPHAFIRSVTIGDRTVENVPAADAGTDEMLLDLPTLNRIGRFSFDPPQTACVSVRRGGRYLDLL